MGCDAEEPSAWLIGGSRWQWLSVIGGELGEEMGINGEICNGDGLDWGFSSAIKTAAGPPNERKCEKGVTDGGIWPLYSQRVATSE